MINSNGRGRSFVCTRNICSNHLRNKDWSIHPLSNRKQESTETSTVMNQARTNYFVTQRTISGAQTKFSSSPTLAHAAAASKWPLTSRSFQNKRTSRMYRSQCLAVHRHTIVEINASIYTPRKAVAKTLLRRRKTSR